jgi:hypothetical protein
MKRCWGWLLLLLLMMVAAGCNKQTFDEKPSVKAEKSLEAASTEWVEEQLVPIEEQVTSVDDRLQQLEERIQNLQGKTVTPFTDVSTNYWAHTEIMTLYDLGIIKGYPKEGKFYPERTLTRYQAASMLVKALKLPLSEAPSVFKDVSNDHPGLKEIMAVYEHGIFIGSDGYFMPNEPIKRRHMAMVLQRAFDLQGNDTPFSGYTDVSEEVEGYDAIKVISQLGIAKGSNGYFKPEDPTKRSHFSAFVYRTLQYKGQF